MKERVISGPFEVAFPFLSPPLLGSGHGAGSWRAGQEPAQRLAAAKEVREGREGGRGGDPERKEGGEEARGGENFSEARLRVAFRLLVTCTVHPHKLQMLEKTQPPQ